MLRFDQRQGSSDGGALLLKAADRRYGLIACMADCLRDERQAGKVDHSLKELLAQRVFSIACGYPDANDAARLAADPIHKLLLDRDPGAGRDLASQPTLSRFENAIGAKELYRLSEALAASVVQRHAERLRGRVRRVTLDLDPTDDPTHGAQQLSFFNGHYDTWCYLPVMWIDLARLPLAGSQPCRRSIHNAGRQPSAAGLRHRNCPAADRTAARQAWGKYRGTTNTVSCYCRTREGLSCYCKLCLDNMFVAEEAFRVFMIMNKAG